MCANFFLSPRVELQLSWKVYKSLSLRRTTRVYKKRKVFFGHKKYISTSNLYRKFVVIKVIIARLSDVLLGNGDKMAGTPFCNIDSWQYQSLRRRGFLEFCNWPRGAHAVLWNFLINPGKMKGRLDAKCITKPFGNTSLSYIVRPNNDSVLVARRLGVIKQ